MDDRDLAYLTKMIAKCINEHDAPAEFFQIYLFHAQDVRAKNFFHSLSGYIPEEKRKKMPVIKALGDKRADLVRENESWLSLEAWRKIWEEANGAHPIPFVNLTKICHQTCLPAGREDLEFLSEFPSLQLNIQKKPLH